MNLGDTFLSNGLLEVGLFQTDETRVSYRLRLDLLPAYPGVLAACAIQIANQLMRVDRLVCPSDSVPLGVAVSMQTKIPLVYSRGKGEAPVQDWVGAYDVGHPAALVCNTLPDRETYMGWHKQLTSVGLQLVQVLALVEVKYLAIDVPTVALFRLEDWLRLPPENLPAGAARAMLSDLEK
jgi:hypothetical protein